MLGLRVGLAAPGLATGLPWGGLVTLGLLGIALGRRPGVLLAVGTLGATLGALAAGQGLGASQAWLPDPERPVVAVVEVTGHWRRFEESWSAPVRIVRLRQGTGARSRVRSRPLDVWLRVEGSADPPLFGARLRVRGHLRRAPPLGNVPRTPPGPWRLSCKSRRLLEEVARPGPVGALAGALRRRVEWAIAATGAGPSASSASGPGAGGGSGARTGPAGGRRGDGPALVRALVLGDGSGVRPAVRQGLRRLGLSHVLAVSGLHVALVAGVAAAAGSGLGRFGRLVLALGAMGAYLLVVGPRPSLLRASVMGCLAVAALIMERPPQAANALAVATAALALQRPEIVLDLGFRLTVGATAGIVLLGPRLLRAWEGTERGGEGHAREVQGAGADGSSALGGAGRWLRRSLAASLGAQIGVLPWALPAFFLLTPWAPVANLLAVPWTALSLGACLLWTGVACVSPAAAGACAGLVDLVAMPFSWSVAVPPRPWISLPLALAWAGAACLAGGLMVALLRATSRRRLALGGAALVTLLFVCAWTGEAGDGSVSATVIDVGQGDAILLQDGRSAVLVDGGGWRHGDLGGRVLLPVLARRGVRRLDAVIVSHPDRDHCGGLVDIAGYLAVEEAVTGPGVEETSCGRALAALSGLRHRVVAAGATLAFGRWRLRVLHPEGGRKSAGGNDESLVIMAEALGRRLLLTGDVEAVGEARLLRGAGEALACDLLKVAHHGSRSSTGSGFLDRARPLLAVISAGEGNPYGHPASEVVERLRRRRVTTFRTDREGMVVIKITPGGSMRIERPSAPKGSRMGAG